MSDTSITFARSEATIDEIATNMETGRAAVLRDAVTRYLAEHRAFVQTWPKAFVRPMRAKPSAMKRCSQDTPPGSGR